MGKKGKATPYPSVDPRFQKEMEERYGPALDIAELPEGMKISARLVAVADPFDEGELTPSLLYDCATIAWNECREEDHDFKTTYALNNMLVNFENYRHLINLLKERKRLLYPDERRGVKQVGIFLMDNGDLSVNVVADVDIALTIQAAARRLEAQMKKSRR